MSNKNSNIPYDQIPHIVINHPETNPDHWAIMIVLYKILKDKNKIIYTNETLAANCRMSLRNVERRISELTNMGFIICTGRGFSRRISLGLLFNNSAILAVGKSSTANMAVGKSPTAKFESPTAKIDVPNRQYGGHSKHSSKNSSKCNLSSFSLSHDETKEIEYCLDNNFSLTEQYKHLQPIIDWLKNG